MAKLKYKTFTIGGVRWKIISDPRRMDDTCTLGICESPRALITIDGEIESQDIIDQTIWHEALHAILRMAGFDEINKNEEFVQAVSLLLHQYDKSRK